jgi:hypothetical protein
VKTGGTKVLKFQNRSLILISYYVLLVTLNSGCEYTFNPNTRIREDVNVVKTPVAAPGTVELGPPSDFRKIKNDGGLIQSRNDTTGPTTYEQYSGPFWYSSSPFLQSVVWSFWEDDVALSSS